MYRVDQKPDCVKKFIIPVNGDIGRYVSYIKMFITLPGVNILKVAIFKYSLHKFVETILH